MALNLGYKFETSWESLSTSVGLGYMYTELDLGKNIATDEMGNVISEVDSWENCHALGLGFGIEYYAQLSIGFTYKYAKSVLGTRPIQVGSETRDPNSNANLLDYGLHLYVPVLKFYSQPIKGKSTPEQSWLPNLDVSLGYAKTNISDPVTYSYENEPLPLPRIARLGYAISTGLEWFYINSWYEIIKVDYSADATDLLIANDQNKSIQTGFLGDIDIGKNMIKGTGDENVVVHKGYRLQFFETFQILNGKWEGDSFSQIKTSGYVFQLKGLLKFLAATSSDSIIKYLGQHFDLQYIYSKADGGQNHPLTGTEYQSISIIYRGFEW